MRSVIAFFHEVMWEAEVDDFDHMVIDHKVLSLDISVHVVPVVHLLQSGHHLQRNFD